MRAALYVLASVAFAATAAAQPATEQPASQCRLTDEDLAANARLSFEDFDQAGTTPATARKLGERGCFAEAARATEHFLIHGPILDDYRRNVVRWHLGQYLALGGDEAAATRVIASARRAPNPERPTFDWNSYVVGTWAFLTRNRAMLEEASARLSAAPDDQNGVNARVLQRLLRCFGQSYREAYQSAACEPPPQSD